MNSMGFKDSFPSYVVSWSLRAHEAHKQCTNCTTFIKLLQNLGCNFEVKNHRGLTALQLFYKCTHHSKSTCPLMHELEAKHEQTKPLHSVHMKYKAPPPTPCSPDSLSNSPNQLYDHTSVPLLPITNKSSNLISGLAPNKILFAFPSPNSSRGTPQCSHPCDLSDMQNTDVFDQKVQNPYVRRVIWDM